MLIKTVKTSKALMITAELIYQILMIKKELQNMAVN